MKIFLFILISIVSTQNYAKGVDSNAKIFVNCMAAQGNGFNWGSTLGWLSEIVRQSADKASTYERRNTGERAYIDLQCFAGASSSSFTNALFAQLLDNRHLVNKKHTIAGRRVLTAKQARKVADALHFMSLATDFNTIETTRILKSTAASHIGFHDRNQQNSLNLNLWKRRAGDTFVIDLFTKRIVAARYLELNEKERALIKSLKFASLDRMKRLAEQDAKDLKSKFVRNMVAARDAIDKYITKDRKKAFLASKLSDHMCINVFLLHANKQTTKPFRYKDFRLAYLCNQATYEKLRKSKTFARILKSSSIMKDKIILASTKSWKTAVNMSMREPGLLDELSGRLNEDHMGIMKASRFVQGRFQALDTNSEFLVMGGFPGARMQAWAVTALAQEQMQAYKSAGYESEARLSTFGKIDQRSEIISFDARTITEYFSEQRLQDYYQWQDDFCHLSQLDRQDFHVDLYNMDWNLSSSPASIGNRAYILTAKGINLVRIQTDYAKHGDLFKRKFVYDPMDDLKFIPKKKTACPSLP